MIVTVLVGCHIAVLANFAMHTVVYDMPFLPVYLLYNFSDSCIVSKWLNISSYFVLVLVILSLYM